MSYVSGIPPCFLDTAYKTHKVARYGLRCASERIRDVICDVIPTVIPFRVTEVERHLVIIVRPIIHPDLRCGGSRELRIECWVLRVRASWILHTRAPPSTATGSSASQSIFP